ncbi:MAG: B12-binding domain-containing radical SAM protein [Deltaproteobacteria bacterium]|nr:MAG: B12-binding domain-containing radical SAM protein [Deltaproteobacteria bacterium]
MPTVTLITPCPPDISAFGTRSISSFLRSKGHQTNIIFFPGVIGLQGGEGTSGQYYNDTILTQVKEICSDSSLVVISFMTSYLERAIQLTTTIRKDTSARVLWGGMHTMLKPETVLDYHDLILVGEGEEAILELVEQITAEKSVDNIQGIWTRKNGHIIDNGIRPPIQDLDQLPFYDFSSQHHYLHEPEFNRISIMNEESFKNYLTPMPFFNNTLKLTYRTITDRGCPHVCTYCNAPALKRLFEPCNVPYFRHRSPAHVIKELSYIIKKYPFVEAIQFFDDTFFSRPARWFEEFAIEYKKQIDLPFYCQTSPTTVNRKKLELLMDAGLVFIEMGIQTGSDKIRKLYRRKETNQMILDGVRLIHSYFPRLMMPVYHFIIDNPWETEEDQMDTVRLIADFPKPFGLAVASLIFFPDTGLFERARDEGLVFLEKDEAFHPPFYIPHQKNYPGFLLYLLTFPYFPKSILKVLMHHNVAAFFSRHTPQTFYQAAHSIGEFVRSAIKGFHLILRGDFKRIIRYFKRRVFTSNPANRASTD